MVQKAKGEVVLGATGSRDVVVLQYEEATGERVVMDEVGATGVWRDMAFQDELGTMGGEDETQADSTSWEDQEGKEDQEGWRAGDPNRMCGAGTVKDDHEAMGEEGELLEGKVDTAEQLVA